ncbi:glycosyltransferase [Microbacterium aoyamense]|uniref:D-inositol 3-phosphate glycosyltransferase n=1 Tax=Microbacterium aoyamense TaxID=344166 RepID=A0ABN2PNC4_9MICO|nr:glycosyltransferase [Microbacterium aoyamense]
MTSRLLLFTNDYPYASGDAVFVEKEIRDLAATFDDVVVFCHARDTSAGVVEMPGNVALGGNLFVPVPEDRIWTPLTPRYLGLIARAAWAELRAGRLLRHARLFLMAARVGVTQANRRAVRDAVAGADRIVAYGFWGMGGGLAVPWVRGVDARVVRVHGYDLYEYRSASGYLPFRPFLFDRADRILTISQDGARYVAERHPQRGVAAKIRVSRLGVPGPRVLERSPRAGERLVVSCSAVSDLKRVGLILSALKVLPGLSADRPVRWVHFGDGPLADELAAAAAELPEGLTVELAGRTPNAAVTDFYDTTRVDVFVNASTTEGVPVSIMEAIARGIPIVATSVGGTPEIVGPDLGTGELVPREVSARALAEVIRAVLDAPDDAYRPRRLWEREFDVQVTGPRAAELVRTAGEAS